MKDKVSVVVCVKNEEARIEDCLKTVAANGPDEIIVVDGNSTDRTVELAKKFTDKVISSNAGGLTADRQIGIDAAKNELVAVIDADHRLAPNDLQSLVDDLNKYGFDIVQSQLKSHENHSYWNEAEEESWNLTHNIPGPQKEMLGTAPNIYKKKVFEKVRFDDNITKKMDDTDFFYRISKDTDFKFGIGDTKIAQLHHAGFDTYLKKFMWYGYGDGEFIHKNPNRLHKMLFHELIRYPLIYSGEAIKQGKLKAVPFFVLQGTVRFYAMAKYFMKPGGRKKFDPSSGVKKSDD